MTINETDDFADWNKVPSELMLSIDPAEGVKTTRDLMRWMERNGMTNTVLYRRLQEDPDFEDKLGPMLDPDFDGPE